MTLDELRAIATGPPVPTARLRSRCARDDPRDWVVEQAWEWPTNEGVATQWRALPSVDERAPSIEPGR